MEYLIETDRNIILSYNFKFGGGRIFINDEMDYLAIKRNERDLTKKFKSNLGNYAMRFCNFHRLSRDVELRIFEITYEIHVRTIMNYGIKLLILLKYLEKEEVKLLRILLKT